MSSHTRVKRFIVLPWVLGLASNHRGAWSRFKPGTVGYSQVGRAQELPGSWGVHPIPLPRSSTPVGPP